MVSLKLFKHAALNIFVTRFSHFLEVILFAVYVLINVAFKTSQPTRPSRHSNAFG